MENTTATTQETTTDISIERNKSQAEQAKKTYAPIKVKPITYKQIRELRAKDLDPNYNPAVADDPSKLARMADWIIAIIYRDEPNIDEYEYHQLLDLATDTYKRAYQGPE